MLGKVIEFLAVPTHCSRPHGDSGMRCSDGKYYEEVHPESFVCPHERLTFDLNDVTCRSCGKQWKDYGTGGSK